MPATTLAPRGYELGQTVTYTEAGDYGNRAERAGTVWSYGPFVGSMWVIPDHNPRPVVVIVGRGYNKGRLYQPDSMEQSKRCCCPGKHTGRPCCMAYAAR